MLARLLLLLCLLAASPAVAERVRVAIFDFEIIDTSLDGEMKGTSPEEKARLAKLAPALRAKLAASDRYLVVDTEPVTERARAQNFQACGGCDATLAHEAGADVAVTGTVQKVSNLILNLNIYLRDAKDDRLLQSMSADFRGRRQHSSAAGPRRPTPPLRPDLISDREALANSIRIPSPVVLTMRPRCSAILGSRRVFLSAFNLESVPSSSAPMSP